MINEPILNVTVQSLPQDILPMKSSPIPPHHREHGTQAGPIFHEHNACGHIRAHDQGRYASSLLLCSFCLCFTLYHKELSPTDSRFNWASLKWERKGMRKGMPIANVQPCNPVLGWSQTQDKDPGNRGRKGILTHSLNSLLLNSRPKVLYYHIFYVLNQDTWELKELLVIHKSG